MTRGAHHTSQNLELLKDRSYDSCRLAYKGETLLVRKANHHSRFFGCCFAKNPKRGKGRFYGQIHFEVTFAMQQSTLGVNSLIPSRDAMVLR